MIIETFIVLENETELKICFSYTEHPSRRLKDIEDYYSKIKTRYERENVDINISLHNAKSLRKTILKLLQNNNRLTQDPKLC